MHASIPPLVDHLVWIVPDLEAACARLGAALGMEPVLGGRHPAHGTRNALLRLGPVSYLEILSVDPQADPAVRSPRGEMVAETASPTLHEILLHVADFDAMIDEAQSDHRFEVTGVFPGRRVNPDGSAVEWNRAELSAGDGQKLPDVIHWLSEHPAGRLPSLCRLEGVTLTVESPGAIRQGLVALGDHTGLALAAGQPTLHATNRTDAGTFELTGRGRAR